MTTPTRFNTVLYRIRKAKKLLAGLQAEVKNNDDKGELAKAIAGLNAADAAVEAAHQKELDRRWAAMRGVRISEGSLGDGSLTGGKS